MLARERATGRRASSAASRPRSPGRGPRSAPRYPPPPSRGSNATHLAQRPQLRPGPPRLCQVGVVERVLGAVVAPDVALAAQPAGVAGAAVQVRLARRSARPAPAAAPSLANVTASGGSDQSTPSRLRARRERPASWPCGRRGSARAGSAARRSAARPVVVRLQVGARDRPVLVAAAVAVLSHEPPLVLAQEHVGVDQRAAAEPARARSRRSADRSAESNMPEQPLRPDPRSCASSRAACAGTSPVGSSCRARARTPATPPPPAGRRSPSRRSPSRRSPRRSARDSPPANHRRSPRLASASPGRRDSGR